ncbi:MAG: BREX system ATP-binding domain-containing protein [Ferrimicrobium sp.]
MTDADRYQEFFEAEYLNSFVRNGGAAIKFCVSGDTNTDEFLGKLAGRALDMGYQVAHVDAAASKVQMIEQIFFSVARQINWQLLANRSARAAAAAAGYPVPNDSENPSLATLAFYYAVEEKELKRDINQQLQQLIFKDYSMVQEFRIAMLRLCQYELKTGQVSDAERDSIHAWLTGTLRQVSLLKTARIFRKIARHNARQMLFSLTRWLVLNGYTGLYLSLDIRQFIKARPSEGRDPTEIFYSRSAIMDAYESLRQLVDNTDEFANLATIVLCAPEFLIDQFRGVAAYQALKLRIFDEVRDQRRDNPYAALVRLGPQRDLHSATTGPSRLGVSR